MRDLDCAGMNVVVAFSRQPFNQSEKLLTGLLYIIHPVSRDPTPITISKNQGHEFVEIYKTCTSVLCQTETYHAVISSLTHVVRKKILLENASSFYTTFE